MYAFTPLILTNLLIVKTAVAFTATQRVTSPACFGIVADLRHSTCLYSSPPEEGAPQEPTQEPPASNDDKPSMEGNDILNSPAFLKKKLEVLRTDIARMDEAMIAAKQRLEAGKAEWGQQIDDLAKEYKNIQERMTSKSQQGDSEATLVVAKEMLNFFDNYNRAFAAVTPETDAEKAIEAEYKATYESASAIFHELGVEEIATVGTEFDYEFHQAVMQRPSDEYEEGFVCEELQKGYKIGEQLVRPAMVIVTV